MSGISHAIVINAPLAQAWQAISRVGTVQDWHPKVARSPVLSDKDTGIGASRRCEFYDGTSVVETVIGCVENESVQMELSEFSMPVSKASAVMHVRSLSGDRTEVGIAMDYAMKYGPVGWLLDAAMVKPTMRKVFVEVLAGLAHHLETGELVQESVPSRYEMHPATSSAR